MDWTFNGLPIHILIVHFVVIVVPVAALCLLLMAAWPAARKRIGIVSPLIALAALVSVPIATEAGEALEEQVKETALSELHTHLGKDLLPWVIVLFVVALAQWVWYHFFTGSGRYVGSVKPPALRLAIPIALTIAAIVVAIGACYVVFLIGESGARATWG
jgi:hypothetical protein